LIIATIGLCSFGYWLGAPVCSETKSQTIAGSFLVTGCPAATSRWRPTALQGELATSLAPPAARDSRGNKDRSFELSWVLRSFTE